VPEGSINAARRVPRNFAGGTTGGRGHALNPRSRLRLQPTASVARLAQQQPSQEGAATLTRENNGSPAVIGGKSSANVVQMWCTAPLDAPREADFSPSYGRDLDFLWSGRRDSNPRPSPWQGVGISASSVVPSAYVGSVRFVVREVLPNPPRSNTRYYGQIGGVPRGVPPARSDMSANRTLTFAILNIWTTCGRSKLSSPGPWVNS